MSNKERIKEYLSSNGQTSKRELMIKFLYEASPGTISRTCRELVELGEIDKVPDTKFVEYRPIDRLF